MALNTDRNVDFFNQLGRGHFPEYVGLRVTAVSEGGLDAELEVRPQLLAPNGFLHAASVVALADTAAGYACFAHLPAGATSFTTIELKCNFLGTATTGVVRCEARGAHLGRMSQVWDVSVYAADATRAIALFRCTQMILWPK